MNNRVSVKQSHRLIVWATLSALACIAAIGPWFTTIAHACQSMGGGC